MKQTQICAFYPVSQVSFLMTDNLTLVSLSPTENVTLHFIGQWQEYPANQRSCFTMPIYCSIYNVYYPFRDKLVSVIDYVMD